MLSQTQPNIAPGVQDGAESSELVADQARLSVTMPKSLYKQLKILAHDRDLTLSACLIKMIRSEIG